MTYRFLKLVVPLFTKLPFRMRFIHKDRVPKRTGAILAGNHVSYFDPVVIALGPWRPVHFMAKSELFSGRRAFGWLLRQCHAFPIVRGTPDRAAISTATDLLKRGKLVGMFPEGTRKREGVEREAHGGAAMIAIRSGAPVIPVGICGTHGIWPKGRPLPHFRKVVAVFGEPIEPELFTEGGRKERVSAMTDAIMTGISRAKAEAGCRDGE